MIPQDVQRPLGMHGKIMSSKHQVSAYKEDNNQPSRQGRYNEICTAEQQRLGPVTGRRSAVSASTYSCS